VSAGHGHNHRSGLAALTRVEGDGEVEGAATDVKGPGKGEGNAEGPRRVWAGDGAVGAALALGGCRGLEGERRGACIEGRQLGQGQSISGCAHTESG
jgi:hypothetical protein